MATPAPKSISKFVEPFTAITIILVMSRPYIVKKITTPTKPHSSAKAANIKSV